MLRRFCDVCDQRISGDSYRVRAGVPPFLRSAGTVSMEIELDLCDQCGEKNGLDLPPPVHPLDEDSCYQVERQRMRLVVEALKRGLRNPVETTGRLKSSTDYGGPN